MADSPHQFTGDGPGVKGADNCQICGKWFDEHSKWEPTMLTRNQQDRALNILHNMALERTGWLSWFGRWIVSDEPLLAVVRGTGKALEEMDTLSRIFAASTRSARR